MPSLSNLLKAAVTCSFVKLLQTFRNSSLEMEPSPSLSIALKAISILVS